MVDPKRSAAAKKAAVTRAANKAARKTSPRAFAFPDDRKQRQAAERKAKAPRVQVAKVAKVKKVTAKKVKSVTRPSGLQETLFTVDGPKGERQLWIVTRKPYQRDKWRQRVIPIVDFTPAEARAEAIKQYVESVLGYQPARRP